MPSPYPARINWLPTCLARIYSGSKRRDHYQIIMKSYILYVHEMWNECIQSSTQTMPAASSHWSGTQVTNFPASTSTVSTVKPHGTVALQYSTLWQSPCSFLSLVSTVPLCRAPKAHAYIFAELVRLFVDCLLQRNSWRTALVRYDCGFIIYPNVQSLMLPCMQLVRVAASLSKWGGGSSKEIAAHQFPNIHTSRMFRVATFRG
jgi:hypothetical protein